MRRIDSALRWIGLVLAVAACGAPTPATTLPPTSTVTPMPADTASATLPAATATLAATATPSATPAPSATPTETPDPLHTACDHPYWPLRLGAAWKTQLAAGVRTLTVTEVVGDVTNATATLTQTDPDGVVQEVEVICGPDGLRYGDAVTTRPDGHTGLKTVVAYSGTVLIAAELFEVGAVWTWTHTADYDTPSYQGGVYVGQSVYQNTSGQTCTAVAEEEVSVPAGMFTGIRVDCVGTSVSINAAGGTSNFDFNSSSLYVRGVWQVSEVLLSYTIP